MDLVPNAPSDGTTKDKVTELPDDVIHRILSFLDMKYVVQTSLLSRKWKHAWKTMPIIILSNHIYTSRYKFAKFVHEALSRRNNHTQVSTLELNFSGDTEQSFVKPIVNYAYLHNVTKLTMIWKSGFNSELPQDLFSSPTLKHLTLDNRSQFRVKYNKKQNLWPNSPCYFRASWNFPALETMNLSNICFEFDGYINTNVNLFSKCVNLKDLVLHRLEFKLETFNICAPKLINLTITDSNSFPKVFNVVAPQLKNLTASVSSYLSYNSPNCLSLTTEGFKFLEKVNLSFGPGETEMTCGSQILDLFPIVRHAKILIIDVNIIERLSTCMDRILREPGPFINLKCLKINMMLLKQYEPVATILVQVNNYLLHNCRNATTSIVDFPQKRPRQQEHDDIMANNIMANKLAKLEKGKKQLIMALEKGTCDAKLKMQDQIIVNQKAMFDRLKLQYDNMMSRMVECKMVELEMLIESKGSDNDAIRKICFDMKSVMDMIPEDSRVDAKARFSSLFQMLKTLFLTRIETTQWQNIEAEFGFTIKDRECTPSDNVHIHSDDVPDVEISVVPITSAANVSTSSSVA